MKRKEASSFPLKERFQLNPLSILEAKDSYILSRATGLMKRSFDEEIFPTLLFTLLRCPREFKKIRSVPHLTRVILSEYLFKKKLLSTIDLAPTKRHLYLKLFKTHLEYPFGSKGVLGIIVVFNLLKQREAFEEQHILDALRRLIPDASV